jgi:peroxiredoxin
MYNTLAPIRGRFSRIAIQGRPSVGNPSAVFFALFLAGMLNLPAAWAGQAGPSGSAAAETPAAISTAQDFTGTGIDGKSYHLQDLLKKGPVMLDFWTTWCGPCMKELPELQKIWEKYRDQGFTLLTVASDDQRTAAKIKPLALSHGFKFPVLTDTNRKIGNLYNVRNYPTTFLINRDGSVVFQAQGYRPGDEKDVEARVAALLAGGAPKATTPGAGSGASH